MPAVVNRTVGSFSGIKDAEGITLCPRSLKNPKYKIYPVISFVQEEMLKLKAEGLVWGYDVPYLLTGIHNQHPRTAIARMKANDTDYVELYKELWDQEY